MNEQVKNSRGVKPRVIFGFISMVSVALMFVFDIPALMYLGTGLIRAFILVTFFTMADRFTWFTVLTELFARMQSEADATYHIFEDTKQKQAFLRTPKGNLVTFKKIDSQIFGLHDIVFYALFSFAIGLTVLGMWFPVSNRSQFVQKKDETEKAVKVSELSVAVAERVKFVKDSISDELRLVDADAQADLLERKKSLENQISNLSTKIAQADKDRNYPLEAQLRTRKGEIQRAVQNIALNAKFETKKAKIEAEKNRIISKILQGKEAGEGSIRDKKNVALTLQLIMLDVLAVIAPLLVVLMTYLIVFYQIKTGDKRGTFEIIIDEIKEYWEKKDKTTEPETVVATPSVQNHKTEKTEPVEVEVRVEDVREDVRIEEPIYTPQPTTPQQTTILVRVILPREIIAKIEQLGLDLPKPNDIKRFCNRKGTGLNNQSLLKALEDYKTHLGLTSNFNPNVWDFDGSMQPKFTGLAEQWTETVGYSTKKKETTEKTKVVFGLKKLTKCVHNYIIINNLSKNDRRKN